MTNADKRQAKKPWSGRFGGATDASVEAFMSSLAYDRRLAAYDIRGSRAHARMLAKTGVISAEEAAEIAAGLDQVEAEIS